MSKLAKSLAAAAGNAGADAPNVEKVFSTYLYEGGSSSVQRNITNGIDLAGEGGLVWIKSREQSGDDHVFYDTERGVRTWLTSNTTNPAYTSSTEGVTAFNSDGFSLYGGSPHNRNGSDHASWTFRKAPRFFDVVTYTGNGVVGRDIAHDLGVAPGMFVVKNLTDASTEWLVYHRSLGAGYHIKLNATTQKLGSSIWNSTAPTDSVFSMGADAEVNGSGKEYVAYLFAHDPVGEDNDGMIACGSFTAAQPSTTINLGWEPQYLLVKRDDATDNSTGPNWDIIDFMRGWAQDSFARLYANESGSEDIQVRSNGYKATATGFTTGSWFNPGDYIYMAIRAPMMKEPTSATEVFAIATSAPALVESGFPIDMMLSKIASNASGYWGNIPRLTVGNMPTNTTSAEVDYSAWIGFDSNTGVINDGGINSAAHVWMFKRAKGFMDVVTYTGNGVQGRNVNHSLGVVPEIMLIKRRNIAASWVVYHADAWNNTENNSNNSMIYHLDDATNTSGNGMLNYTAPTSSVFTLDNNGYVNASSNTYIAYLFSSLNGVAKCGSYTGNGSSQNIACGFSNGARFVLIKRTDSSGDWYLWDTARGIVAGNDPHLSLNEPAAEVTDDSIDPVSSGFTVNQVAATNINVTSAAYIFLAIA